MISRENSQWRAFFFFKSKVTASCREKLLIFTLEKLKPDKVWCFVWIMTESCKVELLLNVPQRVWPLLFTENTFLKPKVQKKVSVMNQLSLPNCRHGSVEEQTNWPLYCFIVFVRPLNSGVFFVISCLSPVDRILNILNQPVNGIVSSDPNFPQITDLSQVTSEAAQGSGDIDHLEPAPINLPPTVSFVNGKHEVLNTAGLPLDSLKYCFLSGLTWDERHVG